MADLKLAFGANKHIPDGVETAWGARWIWPNDLVWDRQDLKGPNSDALKDWLNAGALNAARSAAANYATSGDLRADEDRLVALYADETGVIIANPQGSHGYLYVAAWLEADVPERMHVVIESHWRDERWEGYIPASDGDPLAYVFRFFNVVDEGDREKLLAIGYTLPSLSVNDHVTVNGNRWLCAPVGWLPADDDGSPHAA